MHLERPLVSLHQLLLRVMTVGELRGWLARWLERAEFQALPGPTPAPHDHVWDLVSALDRQGVIDRRFFEALIVERPKRRAEIEAVMREFGFEPDAPEPPTPSPVPGPPPRPPGGLRFGLAFLAGLVPVGFGCLCFAAWLLPLVFYRTTPTPDPSPPGPGPSAADQSVTSTNVVVENSSWVEPVRITAYRILGLPTSFGPMEVNVVVADPDHAWVFASEEAVLRDGNSPPRPAVDFVNLKEVKNSLSNMPFVVALGLASCEGDDDDEGRRAQSRAIALRRALLSTGSGPGSGRVWSVNLGRYQRGDCPSPSNGDATRDERRVVIAAFCTHGLEGKPFEPQQAWEEIQEKVGTEIAAFRTGETVDLSRYRLAEGRPAWSGGETTPLGRDCADKATPGR